MADFTGYFDYRDLTEKFKNLNITGKDVLNAIYQNGYSDKRAYILLSKEAEYYLEDMAYRSREITRQRFGKIVNIFTPVYLNNYCVNACTYCGFNSANKDMKRLRLSVEEVVEEAGIIRDLGFSQILLVAGEDPKSINCEYLKNIVQVIRPWFSSIGIELHPFSSVEYDFLRENGIDHVSFYQETYDPGLYETYHRKGPKKDYTRRLINADYIGKAKMSRIGMGVLLGLNDFRNDMQALFSHISHMIKKYTFSQVTVSFPRIRHCASTGIFQEIVKEKGIKEVTETNLAQAMFATRLLFNDVGITLSTREKPEFRDNMINLAVNNISAASKTSPGAYTKTDGELDQFTISDNRTLPEIISMLKSSDLESVLYERQYER